MRRTLFLIIVLLAFSGQLFAQLAFGQQVFKWKDENGVVHYSSKQTNEKAQVAKLPQITRGDVKIPKTALATCEGHGGINCGLGADTDGSVVCYDGFKGASNRFSFSCSMAKLDISDIGEIDATGNFTVFLRNSKSIAASGVKVSFHQMDGSDSQLAGPSQIDPFGVGEYRYNGSGESVALDKPSKANITFTCLNCS